MSKKDKNSKEKESLDLDDIIKRITLISMPVTLLADTVTVVMFFASQNEKLLFVSVILIIISFSLLIFYIASYILKRVFNTDKAKEKIEMCYLGNSVKVAGATAAYFHRLSDIIVTTDSEEKSSQNYVEQIAVQLCDSLAAFYSTLLYDYLERRSVSVCIKLIDTNSMFEEDYLHGRLKTLARSGSTSLTRCGMDMNTPLISENSDFTVILSEDFDNEFFACPDLRNIEKEFPEKYKIPYLNTRKNFLKYYKSTIVVPIKLEGRSIARELKTLNPALTQKKLIFGFLCIDSLKVFDTKQEREAFESAVEFSKGFANSLYVYLEKVMVTRLNAPSQEV